LKLPEFPPVATGAQLPPEVLEDELELLELEELLDEELELLLEVLDELEEELLPEEELEPLELLEELLDELDELEEELEELLLEDMDPSWPYKVTMPLPGTLTLTMLFVTLATVFCQ
jgi:hypothetical protein